ncbi:hypothetical protein GDO81_021509 [Engystomops pustulosus]|uniref:Uncharacterized protein n=1 Tax=Engystomops pustulosus TaxID=76066 RepID=A0AAV6YSJ5_ENGPU|nr:hypothetical protein GDO81_021509 [Engystomops pustulosus]
MEDVWDEHNSFSTWMSSQTKQRLSHMKEIASISGLNRGDGADKCTIVTPGSPDINSFACLPSAPRPELEKQENCHPPILCCYTVTIHQGRR